MRPANSPASPPVYIATNNGDVGGGEVMLLRIAEALRELDISVMVVAPEASEVALRAADLGMTTELLPASGRRQWMIALRRWDRRERLAKKLGVLWCNGLVPAAATAGHRDRIVHVHQAPQSRAQQLLLPIARVNATTTLVPSAYMRTVVPGARVLPNWTGDIAATARQRDPETPYVVGFLGRLSPDKGLLVLADAMRILESRQPGRFRLLVAGEPRFVAPAAYAKVDAALTSLGSPVERPGWMERDEFFSRIDVLAMPSLFQESFGLTAAEAMAARVPVAVSDAGALPEVVGPHGTVVPPGNARALADALAKTLGAEPAHAPTGPSAQAPETDFTNAAVTAPEAASVADQFQRWQEHFSPVAGRHSLAALFADLHR